MTFTKDGTLQKIADFPVIPLFGSKHGSNIYFTGNFKDSVDFWKIKLYSAEGGCYVLKLSLRSDVSISKHGLTTVECNIFPNPCSGKFNITSDISEISVRVSDLLGRTVYQNSFSSGGDGISITIDLSTKPKGIYIAEVISEKGKETRKIVVE